MRPASLIRFLFVLVLASTGVQAGTLLAAGVDSALPAGQVLGASTDAIVAATPSLTPYAHLPTLKPNDIASKQFALLSVDSGQLLAYNAPEAVSIASTTKLTTALVVMESGIPLETPVIVSTRAASQPGSLVGIRTGEVFTVHDLLRGLLIVSGNDAAEALAEAVGQYKNASLSPEEAAGYFVEQMNVFASKRGLSNTNFADPSGFDEHSVSTAAELAKTAAEVLKNQSLREIIATRDTTIVSAKNRAVQLVNTNSMLASYSGIIGGKTGYTDTAGHCLVVMAERDGRAYVAVSLHSNIWDRVGPIQVTTQLLDYAFTETRWE